MSCHADDLGGAEGVESIHMGDADLDFGGLAVGVSRCDTLTESLRAAHLDLNAAADVVSRPPFPECPTVVTRGAQGFVAGPCRLAILLPRSAILADRDDGGAAQCNDSAVAAATVIGTVRRQSADGFVA